MKRNNFFSRFIVVTLTAALLLLSGSRAIPVSALADPVQAIAPVYDTQIIQLKDYIDNGGMTASQLDIFYTLAGFYVLGQSANQGTHLVDPYANSSSVKDWLKSCGIELYNTIIGLAPDTVRLPDDSFISTSTIKETLTYIVADLMGAAVKSATYGTYEDFEEDIENSSSYYLPWNLDVQKGLNSIFGIYGGVYNWQFENEPWKSNTTWIASNTVSNVETARYNQFLSSVPEPHVRCNTTYTSYSNAQAYGDIFSNYRNLFIDTVYSRVYLVNNSGTHHTRYPTGFVAYANNTAYNNTPHVNYYNFTEPSFNGNNYATYKDLVQAIYDHNLTTWTGSLIPFYEDFIEHVYVGNSWLDKHEIFNLKDLNLSDSDQQYYTSVPDDENYLLDIKGILNDILNNTDLFNIFINNIFSPDGVLVHDTDLIRISTDIYDLLNQQNPPLPVNLNDISELTDNTYLDLVKERATAAGSTLANLVAFWHNCDSELVYVLFGAGITVLIGAFIGKWGHS